MGKRKWKIKDYLHKTTTKLVNHIASQNISKVYVGWNEGIKQDINIELKQRGIELISQEESYTSKCSFLDLEPIEKQENYLGRRVKRGLFKSSNGVVINADINASYNIGRKSNPEFLSNDRIEVLSINRLPLVPVKLSKLNKKTFDYVM